MSKARDEKADNEADETAEDFAAESRSERWVKYGLNVLLTTLLVVVLAFLVVWGAQRYRRRGDLTSGGSYSLKPQTVAVINEMKAPVKLVSLYPRLKQEPGKGQAAGQQPDFYQPVDDILQEYRRKGKNIEVDSIDPVAEPAKLDRWLVEVTQKYGGNVKNYRELLTGFPATLESIKKVAAEESKKMRQLPVVEVTDDRQADTLNAAFNTVAAFPALLDAINQGIEQELKEKLPDYKGQVRSVEGSLGTFARRVEAVRKALEQLQNEKAAPQPIRDYAKNSLPSYDTMKKQADDVLAKIKGLGELKLDEVRRRLVAPEGEQPAPAIAVMGETDIKLIDFKDVWKSGESTAMGASSSGAPRLRFAGEQQLTSAILSLAQPKRTKVAFVRGGGPAKTGGGGPFGGGGGEFSEIADRLKGLNFEVLEKDVSGQSAQRAMMGGGPPPSEPSDEDIKDAIWVVFSEPQMTQFGPMPGGSPELVNKLRAHLDQGGAAMLLFEVQGDDMASLLKDYGVEVKPNVVAVHEPVRTDADAAEDFIEQARREPPIFVINEFGGNDGGKTHPITSTLQSLDAALVPMLPVTFPGATDAQVTRLLPVPQEPRSWGESDIPSVSRNGVPTYDPSSGDVPGPLYSGAAVEKKDKGRLVVIGNARFANNLMLTIPDPKLRRQKVDVARFPGNGELFTNSIFWLGKMEKMIALSPSALDTPRIRPMSAGTLAFWRVGVLLVGLPALALAAGFVVWRSRQD